MAGSLNHIVDKTGTFRMEGIENLGDAHEALDECFKIIMELTGGDKDKINPICRKLRFPEISTDMQPGGPDAL